ncbi:MAG: hypothetical protein HZB91_01815 [Elusimicrobia bacterium]|nr:hypothetical protein [Elusimicrobiota bacterium]
MSANAATSNWGADGNGRTLYRVRFSSDGFATQRTSDTYNTFALFGGLPANTLCVSSVAAVGNDGTVTAYADLGSTRTLVLWTDGGNGPGTTYVAEVSTDGFSTLNIASTTLNVSAVFGAGGEGSGLQANTTHEFRVKAVNGPNSSAYITLTATATLAAQPSGGALARVEVSSAGLTWGANGNPVGTTYYAQVSTDGFATLNASSQTLAYSATFFSLTPNTTQYLRVAAVNRNGVWSSFVVGPATATLAAQPVSGAYGVVAVSSAGLAWGANGNPVGTTYYAQVSTDGFATLNASSRTLAYSATFFSLESNTTHYLRVAAVNRADTWSGFEVLAATATWAAAPSASSATVSFSSVALGWSAGANHGGTT